MLGAAIVALVAMVAGLSAWLGTRDANTRRTAALSVSDPDSPHSDFNGDGFSDLAVGIPREDVVRSFPRETVRDAGAVQVVYGSADGLAATAPSMVRTSQFWHQDSTGVEDSLEESDHFGRSPTTGDFNGDARSDLAVALLGGAVHVLYGSAEGLSASRYLGGDQVFQPAAYGGGYTQNLELAWGNFDGDGYGDLVVGVPGRTLDINNDLVGGAGEVYVIYGSAGGLNLNRRQIWNQSRLGSIASAGDGDAFGSSLAAGDFDDDQVDDLAIGVSGEPSTAVGPNAGEVNVLYGVAGTGLSATGAQRWRQGSGGILSSPQRDEFFGQALAAGDFNGDSKDDLAVGVDQDRVTRSDGTPVSEAGSVNVIYGSTTTGLRASGGGVPSNQLWHQDTVDEGSEIEDDAEFDDHFGRALAAGDFNGDGSEDLAVGVPTEDVGSEVAAGAVNVIYGSSDQGLDASGDELFHQDRSGIDEEADWYEFFGRQLAAWNFGDGPEDDLAVSAPTDSADTAGSAGLVHLIYGDSSSGLTSSGSQIWTQNSEGMQDAIETGDQFGDALGGN